MNKEDKKLLLELINKKCSIYNSLMFSRSLENRDNPNWKKESNQLAILMEKTDADIEDIINKYNQSCSI